MTPFASISALKKLSFTAYSVTFISQLITILSGLANSVILARGLGAEGRGEIAAVMLWPTLLVSLGGLGLTEATLYFASQNVYSINIVHTSSIFFTLILSIVIIPIGFFLLPIILSAQSAAVIELSQIFLLLIPFGMLLGHYASIFRARLLITQYNILNLIVPVGSSISAFVLMGSGLLVAELIICIHLLLCSLGILYAWYILFQKNIVTHPEFSLSVMGGMLKYGAKVYIGTIWALTNLRFDQVFLASVVSPTQLGFYTVAVKISTISSILSNVVTTVAVPRIAQRTELKFRVKALETIFSNFWWISIVLKMVFLCTLPLALPFLYGEAFNSALFPSAILIIASLFLDARTLLAGGAQVLNSPWLGSKAEIITSIFTVTMLTMFIPSFGIIGAAVVSLCAYALTMFVLLMGLKQEHKLNITQSFALPKLDILRQKIRHD